MAAQTVTDLIRSPASMQFFLQESSFVGTGHVVTASTTKNEKGITVSGNIVIDDVLLPNDLRSPVSIPFNRKIPITPFISDPVWGDLASEKMNGMKVLAFASGPAQKLQLIGLIRLDDAPANFLGDLTSILKKRAFIESDITQDIVTEHPFLASYALRSVFSKPDDWDGKLELAKRVFAVNNSSLSESAFHEAMLALRKCVTDKPETGTALIQLALQDLQSSKGRSLAAKLAHLENIGAESISQRADWSKMTFDALTQKEAATSNTPQELKLIRSAESRFTSKN